MPGTSRDLESFPRISATSLSSARKVEAEPRIMSQRRLISVLSPITDDNRDGTADSEDQLSGWNSSFSSFMVLPLRKSVSKIVAVPFRDLSRFVPSASEEVS